MYWIYLVLFVIVVLTPKMISGGMFFFDEEDVEALIILCFGVFGFVLYLAKEKALLSVFREKLHLQKKANIITRDLSDSYSYIGEINRRFDIIKEITFTVPKNVAAILKRDGTETYRSIIDAAKLLSKTEAVSLRFVNVKAKRIEKTVEDGSVKRFVSWSAERLLASGKTFWEEDDYVIVRSPRPAEGVRAYVIFPKTINRIEDVEVFRMLAAQALLLFCVEQCGVRKR